MLNFTDRLISEIKIKHNPTVVGLDPKFEQLPEFIRTEAMQKHGGGNSAKAAAILRFNKALIDAVHDLVPAVKPQLAYYEALGSEGINAFELTVTYARSKGLIVIADGKRNDIGTTADAYADAYLGLGAFNTDALTVNPYLGIDGIKPFTDCCAPYGKGIFVLVKTSNPSGGQIQDLKTEDGRFLFEAIGALVDEWARTTPKGTYGYRSVGAVVGATYPEQAEMLRKIMSESYILVPGYGAQGGSAADAARNFNADGLGAIVNASRSIMYAYKSDKWKEAYSEESFDKAARAECVRMRDELNAAIGAY